MLNLTYNSDPKTHNSEILKHSIKQQKKRNQHSKIILLLTLEEIILQEAIIKNVGFPANKSFGFTDVTGSYLPITIKQGRI